MRDEAEFILSVSIVIMVMAVLTTFIIYFILFYRKKQQGFQKERDLFKQTLLKTEIEIKEQTLSNISRELHDNFGQLASLIKINLNMVDLKSINEKDQLKIQESNELLKQLIKDIRSLSVSLKGENLTRFGLAKMIQNDVERYQKIGNIDIYTVNLDQLPRFKPEIEVFLYRMVQEIFNNILKHAKATAIKLTVVNEHAVFLLKISDNGIGFNTTVSSKGSGLINLEERCKMIGAALSIESEPGKGTDIFIKMNHEKDN